MAEVGPLLKSTQSKRIEQPQSQPPHPREKSTIRSRRLDPTIAMSSLTGFLRIYGGITRIIQYETYVTGSSSSKVRPMLARTFLRYANMRNETRQFYPQVHHSYDLCFSPYILPRPGTHWMVHQCPWGWPGLACRLDLINT